MTRTWTATHTHFANGNSGKVYTDRRASIVKSAEGWTLTYKGLFATETHAGLRTLADAKAEAARIQG